MVAAGHTILNPLDLLIRPGEQIAIVGPSGAGKSSLLGLLLGWHLPAAGRILTDGVELTRNRLAQLRYQTAWVDPAIQIWNRTLLHNLRYNPLPGVAAELGEVLERADLTRFLSHWPEGLQTSLGEGGARCSGGEGQRIRLGRAMWQQNPRLVLLDEPFRGLDRDRRRRHLDEARLFWDSATMLCVTHDVTETRSFDRVLVVENGNVIEDGNPEDLLIAQHSRYRELFEQEETLREEIWSGKFWRRIRLVGGRIVESDLPTGEHA